MASQFSSFNNSVARSSLFMYIHKLFSRAYLEEEILEYVSYS